MINDRQFFITKDPVAGFEDWKKIDLHKDYTLHYHTGLNIAYQDKDIILLGYAWQVDPNRKSPQEELQVLSHQSKISHEDVFEVEKTWCGRYLLIVGEWIYTDACGFLGVFYDERIVTSSLNVLCTLEDREMIFPDISHRRMPDFVPGMRTPYFNVIRLLPSQLLNYTTKETCTRPLLIDKAPKYSSEEERIKDFVHHFVYSIKNFSKLFPDHQIWLAVTAGRDSRATLACFEKAQVSFSTFTLWHNNISQPDCIIPQRLAKAIHRPYRFIKRDESHFSQKRYEDYKIHTTGMAADADWQFYSYNQYQALQEEQRKIVIVRNGVWEIASDYYRALFGDKCNDLTTLYPGILSNKFFYNSTMEWRENLVKKDQKNHQMSYIDRIYWDLREGCWLSSIEQSFDMMDDIISIQIANSRLIISLLYGFRQQDRIRKIHEEKIATSTCPVFTKIPYDYQYETVKQKIRKYGSRIKRTIKSFLQKNS